MANQSNTPWTPALEQRLRDMFEAGDSFAVIAEAFSMSRNTIAGKCTRLNLRRCGVRPVRTANRTRMTPERRPHIVATPVEPRHLRVPDLKRTHCRYAFGERGYFSFCGHDTNGGSYCQYHSQLVYRRAAA